MLKYYEEQQRIKAKMEEDEKKRKELEKQKEDIFSQFEDSDGTPMVGKYLPASVKMKINNVKDKFGKKFIEMFQRTLFDTIKKSNGDVDQLELFKNYKDTFSSAHPLAHSNGDIPQMIMNNYPNNTVYKLGNQKSATGFAPMQSGFPPVQSGFPPVQPGFPQVQYGFPPVESGFQTLQNNLDYFRHETNLRSRRQLNKFGIPQKYWPNGRPRGSLERHTGNNLRGKYTRIQQSLHSGIQGTSISRKNRLSTSNEYDNNLLKSVKKKLTLSKGEILRAVEKLSALYGTPFTIQGHKEKLVSIISKSPELKKSLIQSEDIKDKTHFSVPSSVMKSRPNDENPLKVEPLPITLQSSAQIKRPFKVNIGEGINTKKYLLPYVGSKDSEKGKIISLFTKLFKEFNFNKKEDKDLILRHIR